MPAASMRFLIPGTLLPKGKGRDELIELRFWLDVQKAAL